MQNNILGYFQYVDDIMIVYNDCNTDVDKFFDFFKNVVRTRGSQ